MSHLIFTAIVVVPLFAPPQPEGSVRWAPGYPFAIPKTGVAVVNGKARAEVGHVLIRAKVSYWEDGCVVTSKYLAIQENGTFGPAIISGLKSGVDYNVMIEITQVRDGEEQRLANISRVKSR